MYAKDLPKTQEEILAWALRYSPYFSWEDLEDTDDNIVKNTNLIVDWVCTIAKKYPELIELCCKDKNTPRIFVADVRVCGGIMPAILIKNFIEKNNIEIKITGKWTNFTEILFD